MSVTKSFQTFGYDNRYDPKWCIGSTTFTTNQMDWAVVVAVEDHHHYDYQLNINGKMIYPNQFYVVGNHAVIPPDPIIATESHSYISGSEESGYPIMGTESWWQNDRYVWYGGSSGGGYSGVYSEPDYKFTSNAEFQAALANGDISPVESKVYFDVYINGTDQPSLFVNWTADDDLPIAGLKPHVWIECEAVSMADHEFTTTPSGIRIPNEQQWFLDSAGDYSYGGSYEDSYPGIAQHFSNKQNTAEKLLNWGFDGVPAFIGIMLRMDVVGYDEHGFQTSEWCELQKIVINKDATYSLTSYSDSQTPYNTVETVVRFHSGEPDYVMPDDDPDYPGGTNIDDDGPGRYDPDDTPDPSDFTDPIGYDGNAVLTKTYAVSESTLQNIGQKLWSQSYFNVLKIQNNPIENIVSVKAFPFAMSGTPENIQVGDISFGINGDKVASVQKKKITGSYTYSGKFHNYLDLAPYTSIKINLPYIGLIQLDPADLLGSKLYVEYVIDLVTGQCMAKLYLDEDATTQKAIPYMNLYGQMGVDVPLTSSDRVQTELRAASAAVTAMGSSIGQMVSGNVGGGAVSGLSDALSIAGADYTTQRTASQSPACTSHASPDIFILIERPAADPATGVDEYGNVDQNARLGYAHLHGFPCHKYKTLGSYPSGSFVQVERRTDIQIAMTAEENRMLEELLTSGVYV